MSESPLVLPSGMKASPERTPGPSPISTPSSVSPRSTPKTEEPDFTKDNVHFPIDLFENRIAIKRADRESISDGGIYIPGNAQAKTMTGLVVGVGEGMRKGDGSRVPMLVAIGDTVFFEKQRSMIEVSVNGYAYHLLAESDLLGRVRADDVQIRSV